MSVALDMLLAHALAAEPLTGPCAGATWDGAWDGRPSGAGTFRPADPYTRYVRVSFTDGQPTGWAYLGAVFTDGAARELWAEVRLEPETCRFQPTSETRYTTVYLQQQVVGRVTLGPQGWIPVRARVGGAPEAYVLDPDGGERVGPVLCEGDCVQGEGVELVAPTGEARAWRYTGPFVDGLRHGEGRIEVLEGTTVVTTAAVRYERGLYVRADGTLQAGRALYMGPVGHPPTVAAAPAPAPGPSAWQSASEARLRGLAGVFGEVGGRAKALRELAPGWANAFDAAAQKHLMDTLGGANQAAQAVLVSSNEVLEGMKAHGCPTGNIALVVQASQSLRDDVYARYAEWLLEPVGGAPPRPALERLLHWEPEGRAADWARAGDAAILDLRACTRPL